MSINILMISCTFSGWSEGQVVILYHQSAGEESDGKKPVWETNLRKQGNSVL